MEQTHLKKIGLKRDGWTFLKSHHSRSVDSYFIEGVCAKIYTREEEGVLLSIGIFYLHGEEIYRAWGLYEENHCSYYSARLSNGDLSEPVEGCPDTTVDSKRGLLILVAASHTIIHNIKILKKEHAKKNICDKRT